MLEFLGILSSVVFLAGCFPYIRDILRRTTIPERAPWFIWTVLGVISFFALLSEGATWSLLLIAAFVLGDLVIFGLSLKYGVGGLRKRVCLHLLLRPSGYIYGT